MSKEVNSEKIEENFFNVATIRSAELIEKPIQGNFDPLHLQKIHAYIFQDEKKFREEVIKPGTIRDMTPQDWFKYRKLEAINLEKKSDHPLDAMYPTSMAVYSRMDRVAEHSLFNILDNADPENMKEMDTKRAARYIANLYEGLDFIHPFNDGNSRTIRSFTTQFSKEAGFNLDWSKISQNQEQRELIYVARDMASLERGIDSLSDFYKKQAESRLELFKDFPRLDKLVETALTKHSLSVRADQSMKSAFADTWREVKGSAKEGQTVSQKNDKGMKL